MKNGTEHASSEFEVTDSASELEENEDPVYIYIYEFQY